MVGGNGMSLCRVAVEFRPEMPLTRSNLFACLAASTMIVGIGFGVAVNLKKIVVSYWCFINKIIDT